MTSLQTEIKTTTQTITQEPEQDAKILSPIINQQMEPGKIYVGPVQPLSASGFQTTEGGASITNFQKITNVSNLGGQSQIEGVLNPIYTKEVKETQVHDLGEGQGLGEGQIEGVLNPIYTKEVKETQVHDLGTVNLGTVDLGTVKVNQTIEEDGEIEAVLKPIYTKEVRQAIIKEIKPIVKQDVQPVIKSNTYNSNSNTTNYS